MQWKCGSRLVCITIARPLRALAIGALLFPSIMDASIAIAWRGPGDWFTTVHERKTEND